MKRIVVLPVALAISCGLPVVPASAEEGRALRVDGVGQFVDGYSRSGYTVTWHEGAVWGNLGKGGYWLEYTRACATDEGAGSADPCTDGFSATLTTKHGTLELTSDGEQPTSATSPTGGTYPFRIVGGTGKYADATGSGTAVVTSDSLDLDGRIALPRGNDERAAPASHRR